eukprot:GHVN01091863.1.p1 GENE.GHVN01091863.1~~GHVN01091863.1.p1  ORF type:complete len:129 (+),score=9.49 GHVN01091863.1:119-505(+)
MLTRRSSSSSTASGNLNLRPSPTQSSTNSQSSRCDPDTQESSHESTLGAGRRRSSFFEGRGNGIVQYSPLSSRPAAVVRRSHSSCSSVDSEPPETSTRQLRTADREKLDATELELERLTGECSQLMER